MTCFGWDASHFDGTLTRAILARARAEGIVFFTHKLGEGLSNVDDTQGTALAAARDAGIALIGGYYIPHQDVDPAAQARRCVALADRYEPWWRGFPGWFWQCDAERWSAADRVTRAEVAAFSTTLAELTSRVVVCYASRGQYGDDLAGVGHPLWNANYGANHAGPFTRIYPGDASAGWAPYSGQAPAILQYSSAATIAGLGTCDANAFRGTAAQLGRLLAPRSTTLTGGTTMTQPVPLTDTDWRVFNLLTLSDPGKTAGSPVPHEANRLAQALKDIQAGQAAAAARDAALLAAVQALAAGGTSVDTSVVLAAIQTAGQTESAAVQALQAQVADLTARLAAAGHALGG